jgi:hypothetical protein
VSRLSPQAFGVSICDTIQLQLPQRGRAAPATIASRGVDDSRVRASSGATTQCGGKSSGSDERIRGAPLPWMGGEITPQFEETLLERSRVSWAV